MSLDTDNPDLHALVLTVGFAQELIDQNATSEQWIELTTALHEEHTPEQLANMLTGAAAIIAKSGIGQHTTDTAARNASSSS